MDFVVFLGWVVCFVLGNFRLLYKKFGMKVLICEEGVYHCFVFWGDEVSICFNRCAKVGCSRCWNNIWRLVRCKCGLSNYCCFKVWENGQWMFYESQSWDIICWCTSKLPIRWIGFRFTPIFCLSFMVYGSSYRNSWCH